MGFAWLPYQTKGAIWVVAIFTFDHCFLRILQVPRIDVRVGFRWDLRVIFWQPTPYIRGSKRWSKFLQTHRYVGISTISTLSCFAINESAVTRIPRSSLCQLDGRLLLDGPAGDRWVKYPKMKFCSMQACGNQVIKFYELKCTENMFIQC